MLPRNTTFQGATGYFYTAGSPRVTPYQIRVYVSYVANPLSYSAPATILGSADLTYASGAGSWQPFTMSSSATSLAAGGAIIFGLISSSTFFPTTYTYLLSGTVQYVVSCIFS